VNVILTTCKNRRQHLGPALASWRQFLAGWVPLLVAVDDPEAVALLSKAYFGQPWHAELLEQPEGFSKLQAQAAGVRALPDNAETVAMLDADVIALLGVTNACLSEDLQGGFLIANHRDDGSDFCDDMGQLVAPANVLRDAFQLLGDVSAWWGYGWDDVLIRCACWLVTDGKVRRRPAMWAHMPNTTRERLANFGVGETTLDHAGRNRPIFLEHLARICEPFGIDDWRKTGMVDVFWRGAKGRAFLP